MNLMEITRSYCIENDIHESCLFCTNSCKQEYNYWSGQMSNNDYCSKFNNNIQMDYLTQLIIELNKEMINKK